VSFSTTCNDGLFKMAMFGIGSVSKLKKAHRFSRYDNAPVGHAIQCLQIVESAIGLNEESMDRSGLNRIYNSPNRSIQYSGRRQARHYRQYLEIINVKRIWKNSGSIIASVCFQADQSPVNVKLFGKPFGFNTSPE
jgi:hypothetical protein